MSTGPSLALIAGQGALPLALITALEARGTVFRLCEVEGFASQATQDRPVLRFRIETLGSFIANLVELGVTQVCLAGAVPRPRIDPQQIDAATMPLVPRMMSALQAGDDKALRLLLSFFEEAGITPVSALDIVPDLMPPPGAPTKRQPEDQDRADSDRGIEVLNAMAVADIGQSCVIAAGQALAVECIGGTDWMLRSLMHDPRDAAARRSFGADPLSDPIGFASDWLTGTGEEMPSAPQRDKSLPPGGVLVKTAKRDQDMRVDIPVIGPATILGAARVELRGVVVEAGRVMVLDLAACIEAADQHGIFLWIRD